MRIAPVNRNNFTGIYKLPMVVGYHTGTFIIENAKAGNLNSAALYSEANKYQYVITKDDEEIEKEFEAAVEKDHGKYWKLPPLMDIWINGSIAQAAFKIDKDLNNGHENWTDFKSDKPDKILF